MKTLFRILIGCVLIVPGCINGNKKDEAIVTDVKETPENPHDVYNRFMDSLKTLRNNKLVLLDSLTGIKNSSRKENNELNKKIEEEKKEVQRLLIKIEEHTVTH